MPGVDDRQSCTGGKPEFPIGAFGGKGIAKSRSTSRSVMHDSTNPIVHSKEFAVHSSDGSRKRLLQFCLSHAKQSMYARNPKTLIVILQQRINIIVREAHSAGESSEAPVSKLA